MQGTTVKIMFREFLDLL